MNSRDSLIKHQSILYINSGNVINKKVSKRSRRSVNGCICCKKRKVKCDETRPQCCNCIRNGLTCFWSKAEFPICENLSHERFVLSIKDGERPSLSELESKNYYKELLENDSWSPDELANKTHFCYLDSHVSGTDYFLYYIFINRFLPTVAHPFIRSKFATGKVFLLAGAQQPILRNIFFACGASLLASNDDRFKRIYYDRYAKSLLSLTNEMKSNEIKDWYFGAIQVLQILCLRDRFTSDGSPHGILHFKASFELIMKVIQGPKIFGGISESLTLKNPLTRVVIENFIFNYSIVILLCNYEDLNSRVPNPFECSIIFKSSLSIEESIEDTWFDSNAFELILRAFEIAAKCSWLSRMSLPLSKQNREIHEALLGRAQKNLNELNSISIEGSHKYFKCNISIAKIVTKTSIILIHKMLFLKTLSAYDFQDDISYMVSQIEQPHNDEANLPIWSLFIGVLASTTSVDRRFFRAKIVDLSHRLNSNTIRYVLDYLDGICEVYQYNKSFELLFKHH